jgi:hypothetical protein
MTVLNDKEPFNNEIKHNIMKKTFTIAIMATLLMVSFSGIAQPGIIVHSHFDPPVTLLGQLDSDTLKIDLDKDDLADFGFCWLGYPWWEPYLVLLNPNCDYMLQNVGDTSSMTTPEMQWQHHNGYISVEDEYKWCIRLKEGGDYYYGWAYTDAFSEPNPGSAHNKLYIAVHDIAYCTIPNYPLHWGQTNTNWGVDETESTAFSNVYPNPTSGLVTITGQDLKSAEVFNTLGQQVATATGEGETLQVDLNGLPAGVYFVNITDKEGRKCVQKVVKE